jgi:hypothetical protein
MTDQEMHQQWQRRSAEIATPVSDQEMYQAWQAAQTVMSGNTAP